VIVVSDMLIGRFPMAMPPKKKKKEKWGFNSNESAACN